MFEASAMVISSRSGHSIARLGQLLGAHGLSTAVIDSPSAGAVDRLFQDMTPSRSPSDLVSGLQARRRSRPGGWTTQEDLHDVDQALAVHPTCAELWILRGDFIQLCDDPSDAIPIEEALRSYQTAADLAPTLPEPLMEIGHYLDSIADDPAGAIPFFERAIALGAGQPARDALHAARQQLGD